MGVSIIDDPVVAGRVDRLAEQIGDVGKGCTVGEMQMALCLALAAGVTLSVPREHWHRALADITFAIGSNIGNDGFTEHKPSEH